MTTSAAEQQTTGREQPAERPAHLVNITEHRQWRWSRRGSFGLGVYEQLRTEDGDAYWQQRATLPVVHARVLRRDSGGRVTATRYLISEVEDSPQVLVGDDDLRDGTWAGRAGMELSTDRTIITAAGTAIKSYAYRYAPVREASPRPDAYTVTGHLDMPLSACLPDGYLRVPHGVPEQELADAARDLVAAVAQHPKMALVMGDSGFSPFVGPLRRQAHWVDMHGPKRQGKSTTLTVAASIWGEPRKATGIILSWDASSIGSGRHLGQLGILPPFFDERGVSPFGPAEWGQLIYRTCEGSSRLTAQVKGDDTRKSAPWFGVLFSTGNHRLTDGCAAGRFDGIPARVVELRAPFTANAVEADRIARTTDDGGDGLAFRCYGWIGPKIMEKFSIHDVRRLIKDAENAIGKPEGGEPRTISEHLHGAIAGAMMIDAVAGTGTVLTDAATLAAREYLDQHSHTPETDADRMLMAIHEGMFSRRSAWPSETDWIELGRPRPETINGRIADTNRLELAQHGYDHETSGIRSANGEWIYVFPVTWSTLAESLGCDSTMALAELYDRKALSVPASVRRQNKWYDRAKVDGKLTPPVYKIRASAVEGIGATPDDPATPDGSGPDTPPPATPGPPCGHRLPEGTPPPIAVDGWIRQAPCTLCGDTVQLDVATHTSACIRCQRPTMAVHGGWLMCGQCYAGHQPPPETPTSGPKPVGAGDTPLPLPESQRPAQPATGPIPGQGRRGASPRQAARKAAQAARLAADIQLLTDATPEQLDSDAPVVKILHALETEYAPQRGGRGPWWRPSLPGIVETAHVVSGYAWDRPYSGPVAVLDRGGAWIAAASSVYVAHGELHHTGPLPRFDNAPGYYQVDVWPWGEADRLPSPLAGAVVGQPAWVPAPTVARLIELAAEGRWPEVDILDSYTGDRARLDQWAGYVNALKTHAVTTWGRDDDRTAEVKIAFGMACALLQGASGESGVGRKWKCGAHRTDWAHAIQAQSSATLHRWADRCLNAAPDSGPIAVRNVDEIVIPQRALEIVTAPTLPYPLVIDETGTTLGSCKVKSAETWEG